MKLVMVKVEVGQLEGGEAGQALKAQRPLGVVLAIIVVVSWERGGGGSRRGSSTVGQPGEE